MRPLLRRIEWLPVDPEGEPERAAEKRNQHHHGGGDAIVVAEQPERERGGKNHYIAGDLQMRKGDIETTGQQMDGER